VNGVVVWITGLPRAGKSTLALAAQARLAAAGRPALLLDGDVVRDVLVPRPGYSPAERDGFYATLAGLAGLCARQGFVVLVAATAHRRAYREAARRAAPRYIEVFVSTPAEICAARPGGELYRDSSRGALPGAGVAYEPPEGPDVVVEGGADSPGLAALLSLIG
jgi:adenylylsulfate kinase